MAQEVPSRGSSQRVDLPVDSTLSYASDDVSCDALLAIPSAQLQQILLPNETLMGQLRLEGALSSLNEQTRCLIHLTIHGTVSMAADPKSPATNVFDLLKVMNKRMEAFAALQTTQPLQLVEASVTVDSKTFALKTLPPSASELTLASAEALRSSNQLSYSSGCGNQTQWLGTVSKLLPSEFANQQVTLLPSELDPTSSNDECALALTVNSQIVPAMTNELTFGLFKSIDDQLNSFFTKDQPAADTSKPAVDRAAVTLNLKPASGPVLSTSVLETSNASSDAETSRVLMAGIAAFVVLCAMFLAVNGMRKEHERYCKEKHANASKAAQLRRISIKMKYNKLKNVPPQEEVEEEKTELL